MKNATLLLLSALVLSACGGGGGSNSASTGGGLVTSSPTLLTGVAASGAPLANTPLTVTMSSSGVYTNCPSAGNPVTDAQGNFSFDISGCSGGFIVIGAPDSTGRILMTTYGPPMQNTATGAAYVNLTPLTTLVLEAAGGINITQALSSINSAVTGFETTGSSPTQALANAWSLLVGLQTSPKLALAESASSVMTWNAWNNGDLFTTPFTANHSGMDAVLDSIMLTGGTTGVPVAMTDLAGNVLEQASGTSLSSGNYAATSWPAAVNNAVTQVMINPTAQLIPAARTYTGTMTSPSGSGTCSLVVSLSSTATPGTISGTCSSVTTGTLAISGTVNSTGQASLSNGASVTFIGGVTAMGGSGTWTNGAQTGTWQIH